MPGSRHRHQQHGLQHGRQRLAGAPAVRRCGPPGGAVFVPAFEQPRPRTGLVSGSPRLEGTGPQLLRRGRARLPEPVGHRGRRVGALSGVGGQLEPVPDARGASGPGSRLYGGRRPAGRGAGGDAERRALAPAICGRSVGARPDRRRQRHGARGDWRDAAPLSVPASLRALGAHGADGTRLTPRRAQHASRGPARPRRDDRVGQPRGRRHRRPARAAASRQRIVERPGGSPARPAHAGATAAGDHGDAGGGVAGARHRLRQRGQPAPGTRHRTAAGGRHPRRARRGPLEARPPAPHRERAAGPAQHTARPAPRVRGHHVDHACRSADRDHPVLRQLGHQPQGRGLHGHRVCRDGPAVRARPRPSGGACQPVGLAEGRWSGRRRQPRPQPPACRTGGRRSGALAHAARRRVDVRPQHRQHLQRRRGHRHPVADDPAPVHVGRRVCDAGSGERQDRGRRAARRGPSWRRCRVRVEPGAVCRGRGPRRHRARRHDRGGRPGAAGQLLCGHAGAHSTRLASVCCPAATSRRPRRPRAPAPPS